MHPSLLLLALLACNPKQAADTGPTGTDSGGGDTAVPPDFEPGCITVDGEGGYASLQDALSLASPGSVIEVCAGSFEEAVTVTIPVTIVGAGPGQTFWSAPANQVPFRFEGADGAELRGLTLSSTRSGIEAEGPGSLRLDELELDGVENYGVDASGGVELELESVDFLAPGWGGLRVDGGEALVLDSSFQGCASFGLLATGGAGVEVDGCSFTDTTYGELDAEDNVQDGFGAWAEEDAELVLRNSLFADNLYAAVYGDSPDRLALSGCSISGGAFGVLQVLGDLELEDVAVEDATYFGVYWIDSGSAAFRASGLAISGDPEVVPDYSLDEVSDALGEGYLPGSTGLVAIGAELSIEDSTISGYNDWGAYLSGYDGSGSLLLSNTRFEDNGRWGFEAVDLDVVAEDVRVSGTRRLDEDDGSLRADYPAGAVLYSCTVDWSGGSASESDGYGLSLLSSSGTVEGASFSGNVYSGLGVFWGSAAVEDCTFTATRAGHYLGSLWFYESSACSASGNTFADNLGDYSETYDWSEDYGYVYTFGYRDVGLDVLVSETHATLEGNSFSGGNHGIYLSSADAEIRGNSWSGYTGTVLTVYGQGDGTVTFEDNVISGWGGHLVYCYEGSVTVSGLDASTQSPEHVDYWYAYDYPGKDDDYEGSFSYDSLYPAFEATSCNLLLEGVELEELAGQAAELEDCSVELDQVAFRSPGLEESGGTALDASWSDGTVEFYASDLLIEGAPGQGLHLFQHDSAPYGGVEIENLAVTAAGGDGIELEGLEGGRLVDPQVRDCGGAGMLVFASTIELEGGELSANGDVGLGGYPSFARSPVLRVHDLVVEDNGSDGIYMGGGELDLDGSTLQRNLRGLHLDGSTTSSEAAVSGTQVLDNEQEAILCEERGELESCSSTVLSGNGLDEASGCSASCSAGEDTGLEDTGSP